MAYVEAFAVLFFYGVYILTPWWAWPMAAVVATVAVFGKKLNRRAIFKRVRI